MLEDKKMFNQSLPKPASAATPDPNVSAVLKDEEELKKAIKEHEEMIAQAADHDSRPPNEFKGSRFFMEANPARKKTAEVKACVEPEIKRQAEAVLKELGIPMSHAINMYLRQIIFTNGIPFELKTS